MNKGYSVLMKTSSLVVIALLGIFLLCNTPDKGKKSLTLADYTLHSSLAGHAMEIREAAKATMVVHNLSSMFFGDFNLSSFHITIRSFNFVASTSSLVNSFLRNSFYVCLSASAP